MTFINPYSQITNPTLLPKARSEQIMEACHNYPCSLRICSFLGRPCSGDRMGVHLDMVGGKGVATKVSDLAVAAGCDGCHRLLDGRDGAGWKILMEKYYAGVLLQCLRALNETHSRLLADGIITVKGEII